MRTLGIVPARGGSMGIARKNLAQLAGRSLVAWAADAALQSCLDRVVLSTDDEEIAAEGRRCGLEVPFIRAQELASDEARSIDVVLDVLERLASYFDAVVLLQPTSPFRTASDIDGALDLLGSSGADSVISVVDVKDQHPARMKYLVSGELVDPPFAEPSEGLRRQDLEPVFIRNGAIYACRRSTVLQGSFKGARSMAWIMPPERSVNIDSELDLILARALAELRE